MAYNKDGSSYLDGVPVKISPKVLPPRPIFIPTAIDTSLSSDLFTDQYDFSLERSVLESIQSRQAQIEAAKPNHQQKTAQSVSSESIAPDNESSLKRTSALIALPWQPNTILQPKLQQSTAGKTIEPNDSKSNDAKINLSDFENDTSSPFDYMELQTINDLEELNNVFQGIQTTEPASASHHPSQQLESTAVEDPPPAVTEKPVQTGNLPGVAKSVSFPLPQNSSNFALTKQISSSFSEDFAITEPKNAASDSEKLQPVFPSLGAAGFSAVPGHVDSFASSRGFTCDNINYPSLSQVPSIPTSAWGTSDKASSLRGSKSYSDITSLSEFDFESSPAKERSRTPPTLTYKALNSEEEPLLINEDYFGKSTGTINGIVNYSEESAYEELKDEAKHFVDCITEMGFAKGQVSRAVKHLGVDEKKVVEHLCQIQFLEESGYESSEAEAALHLHDYNTDQAKEFLELVNQFQDLGFEKDAVKKALVQNKNDWNKTIDALLPSS